MTNFPDDVDVIVIGAGIAGAAAFLEASERGARVLGLDRASAFGGTAARGGAGVSIPGSPMQALRHIADSPQRALGDLCASSADVDLTWARLYFEHAAEDVYQWLVNLGVRFADLLHFEGDTVPRWHWPVGGGAEVMSLLWERFRERGWAQRWRFDVEATGFSWLDDRVSGVTVDSSNGQVGLIRAKSVIVATGGFAGNLPMVLASSERLRQVPRTLAGGGPGAQGLGHSIMQRNGIELTRMANIYVYAYGTPDWTDPKGERGIVVRGSNDWIWVNRDGRRFHDEAKSVAGRSATDHLLEQDGATCWAIMDSVGWESVDFVDHYSPPNSKTRLEKKGAFLAHSKHVFASDALAQLAGRIGIESRQFQETIKSWNRTVAAGNLRDALTGRSLTGARKIERPPFYAIQFFPTARKTLGGVKTDLRCRVLGKGGQRIPGLFAAGELCGLAGGHIGGTHPLEGMMVGASLFSGRIAGRTVIEHDDSSATARPDSRVQHNA